MRKKHPRPRQTGSNSRLKKIRAELGLTQEDFKELIGVKHQQSVSTIENSEKISPRVEQRIRDIVPKKFPDKWNRVRDILEGRDDLDKTLALESQTERDIAMPEGDAWCFALQFRNAPMLDRIACHARAAGLGALRVAHSVVLTGPRIKPGKSSLTDLLYPSPPVTSLGLEPGMVILLGDPQNHESAKEVLARFLGRGGSRGCPIRISVFPEKRSFFGYDTSLKVVQVRRKAYQPRRWVDPKGPAICYEDFGVIYSAGIAPLLEGEKNPFPGDPSHWLLIAGLHRLATGVGVALLENLELRKQILKSDANIFHADRARALAYCVVVRADNRLWFDTPGFEWSASEVKSFSVLGRWSETVD